MILKIFDLETLQTRKPSILKQICLILTQFLRVDQERPKGGEEGFHGRVRRLLKNNVDDEEEEKRNK